MYYIKLHLNLFQIYIYTLLQRSRSRPNKKIIIVYINREPISNQIIIKNKKNIIYSP